MGLFSNSKKGCPVCGEATPRLLPTKIAGTPICKECANKIYLPQDQKDQMSVEEFVQYISFYEENQALRDKFFDTYHYNFGFFGDDLMIDTANGLFRMKNNKEALVFSAKNLKSFRILEGSQPLFESQGQSLKCHKSNVKDQVSGMHVLISQFNIQKVEYERMERMQREREERAKEKGETVTHKYIQRPSFKSGLFERYYIELTFDHPYWREQRWDIPAPTFDTDYPRVDSYLVAYDNSTEEMHAMALNLMQLISPNAQEISSDASCGSAAQATPAMDSVEALKKYKELLDMGVITDEEFAAKKRQLLGI